MSKQLRLFLIIVFISFSDSLIIGHFLTPFLKYKLSSLVLVANLISLRKIIRIVLDIPFGLLAQKIGLKKILILSRVIKIVSLILLLSNSKPCIIISMILYGAAHAGFYGKFEVYIYNFLNANQNNKSSIQFRRTISICYFIQDISLSISAIIGMELLQSSYNSMIVASISTIIIFLLPTVSLPEVDNINQNKNNKNTAQIIRNLGRNIIKKNVIQIILLFSITNAVAFCIPDLLQFAAINIGAIPKQIAILGIISSTAISIGCIISIILCTRLNNTKQIIKILSFVIIIPMITNMVSNNQYTILFIIPYLLIYPTIETLLESKLDTLVTTDGRTTVTSVGTTMSTIFGVLIQTVFIMIAEKTSYRYAICGLYITLLTAFNIIYAKIRQ